MPELPDLKDPVAIAQHLLRFETPTPAKGDIFQFLKTVFLELGLECKTYIFGQRDNSVENILSYNHAQNVDVMFAGHVDIVSPGPEKKWRYAPYSGQIEDGILYGRGAVDMKGAIACMIAAAARHKSNAKIGFLITGDEEGPALEGTDKVLKEMDKMGLGFDLCVLGEPTSSTNVCDVLKPGRRGSLSGTLSLYGRQGHSAYPERAKNPVMPLAEFISKYSHIKLDDGNGPFPPSRLVFTALSTDTKTHNVIPGQASVNFNIRFNDLWSADSLKTWLEKQAETFFEKAWQWEFDYQPANSPAFITPIDEKIIFIADIIEKRTGYRPEFTTGGGTSDARFIYKYGAVVEIGLVGQTMHQIDECVPIKDLELLTNIYGDILEKASA